MRKRERALWGKGTSGVLGPRDSLIYQQLCLCFQNIPSAIIPLAFQYEQKERKTTNNYDRHTSKGMGKGERNKSVNRTTNNRITGGQFELRRMGEPHCWSDVLYAPCTYSESCWLMFSWFICEKCLMGGETVTCGWSSWLLTQNIPRLAFYFGPVSINRTETTADADAMTHTAFIVIFPALYVLSK